MVLNIRNSETEKLAEALARLTGETKTEAVAEALCERLARVRLEPSRRRLADEFDAIARHCAALPALDTRSPEAIIGYDERGVPR